MADAIFVIITAVIFGACLTFASIHMFKNFKKDKDAFLLMFVIIADIAYLVAFVPAGIKAITSLL